MDILSVCIFAYVPACYCGTFMPQCTHVDQRIKLGIFPHLALDRIQDSMSCLPLGVQSQLSKKLPWIILPPLLLSLGFLGLYMYTACLAFMLALQMQTEACKLAQKTRYPLSHLHASVRNLPKLSFLLCCSRTYRACKDSGFLRSSFRSQWLVQC